MELLQARLIRDDPHTSMPFPATAIANEFLKIAKDEAEPITPLHIQKYVYFAHGWHLALKTDPLIRERVYAWDYGPVIPNLYHAFKQYGSSAITAFAKDVNVSQVDGKVKLSYQETWIGNISEDEEKKIYTIALVKRVWDVYSVFSAIQLSNLTHADDSPWSQARQQHQTVIPDELIREYFKNLAQQGKGNG
jgi:uncharacterized phage-associated protein